MTIPHCLLSIQLASNAEGECLRPLVVHDGSLSEFILETFAEKLLFFDNKDGEIDFDCIGTMANNVYK